MDCVVEEWGVEGTRTSGSREETASSGYREATARPHEEKIWISDLTVPANEPIGREDSDLKWLEEGDEELVQSSDGTDDGKDEEVVRKGSNRLLSDFSTGVKRADLMEVAMVSLAICIISIVPFCLLVADVYVPFYKAEEQVLYTVLCVFGWFCLITGGALSLYLFAKDFQWKEEVEDFIAVSRRDLDKPLLASSLVLTGTAIVIAAESIRLADTLERDQVGALFCVLSSLFFTMLAYFLVRQAFLLIQVIKARKNYRQHQDIFTENP
mmetsp:Transcript_11328/g.24402  ORF Transcript_11328/g.24402 Transcript_11328/m.24402 type:complete len:268 (-) Transcript_11328:21-824(-)